MTKTQRKRLEALMPNGIPKFIRAYDNGGETADRYTVVFNGRYRYRGLNRREHEKAGPIQVLNMSEAPTHPQGVGQHVEWQRFHDAPEGWAPAIGRKSTHAPSLGRRIRFEDLPEECRRTVIRDYIELWDLPSEGQTDAEIDEEGL